MKILAINQFYHPFVASTGQILTELCSDLAGLGHDVTVITGLAPYRDEERAKASGGRLYEVDRHEGVRIIRVYNYLPAGNTFAARFFQYITFFVSSFIAAQIITRPDVTLYLTTPPLLNGVTALALKVLKGVPEVYCVQDLFPDVAVELKVIKTGLLYKICAWVEKLLYREAAAIVPVGRLIAVQIINKGAARQKLKVISNWIDESSIKPLGKDTQFARSHDLKDKFVVQYSGNIGLSQGLETTLRAAKKLEDIGGLLFLIIGGGTGLESLKKLADKLRLDNVKFMPYQPREILSESLSAADVSLITLKKGLSRYSVPSKIFGIMASGRPVIASVDPDGEIAGLVKDADAGLVITPEDPDELADAIMKLRSQPELAGTMGKNARNYLEENLTRSASVSAYAELLERVAGV